MGKLIIDGNSVYEIDEECLKRRPVPDACRVREALERAESKNKPDSSHREPASLRNRR